MTWLTPMTGLLAAAVAAPLLVLLYFLKLRRREQWTSSTLLWSRAVRDLQVNAPFQRLRRNLLLLVQLLTMGCVLAALAGPVLRWQGGGGRKVVLLIDRSASMNATDGPNGRSRLAEAKRQAHALIDGLRAPGAFNLGGSGDQAMVIAFDRHARLCASFTADRSQLHAAVDAIEPSDATSMLGEALTLARAFAAPVGEVTNNRSDKLAADLELFSDGRIGDLAGGELAVAPGEMFFHGIGGAGENVGVIAMQARRSYASPEQVEAFAALANFGPAGALCKVQLTIDGDVRAVREVAVPPRRPGEKPSDPPIPGQVSVSFSLAHPGPGVVAITQLRPDALASDDSAWAVLPPPRRLSVLLVTAGNAVLENVLRSCPLAALKVVAPKEFAEGGASLAAGCDLVVLDNGVPAGEKLPTGRYVIFGQPPADLVPAAPLRTDPHTVIDWQSQHPVLVHVNFDPLVFLRSWPMTVGRDADVLAKLPEGAAVALVRRAGSTFLLVGLDVMESNWPFESSFVIFCYNATAYLGSELSAAEQSSLLAGDSAISVRGRVGGGLAKLAGPGGLKAEIEPDAAGVYRFARTARAGVYTVATPDGVVHPFAVNLTDPAESDITLADAAALSAVATPADEAAGRANQPIWPHLALAALVLVCLEWLIYNSKVRL